MMHYKLLTVFVLFCAAQNALATDPPPNPPPTNVCSSGAPQCCNSVQAQGSPLGSFLGGLVNLSNILGSFGLACSPITVLGGGLGGCNSQAACCTGNTFYGGLIVLACNNIGIAG